MRKLTHSNSLILFVIASLSGLELLFSPEVRSAQWLAPAASDHITADWVQQIEADLNGEEGQRVFQGIPADSPVPSVLHLLNHASKALAEDKKEYARSFIDQAIGILDRGVSRGWYSRSDIAPITTMISERATEAIEGRSVSNPDNPRWTGYVDNDRLGLSNTRGDKQQVFDSEPITQPQGK